MSVQIGHTNIAESGTTTAVSTATNYHLYRLFDRFVHDLKWKSGTVGVEYTSGGELITNGGFTSTTGWSTADDCTLSAVTPSPVQSGDCLSVNYSYATTGSNLVTNGDFSSVTTPWSVGSSEYSASIVGSGQSGNAVNIYNGITGSNLVTNPGFESSISTEWTASPGALTRVGSSRTGSYAAELTYSGPRNLVTNGDFSSWVSLLEPSDWTSSGASVARQSVYYHSSPYSAQLTCSPATDHIYQDISVTIGKTYRVSGWVARTTSGTARIAVRTTAGDTIKEGIHPTVTLTPFRYIEFFFVATDSTVRLCLGLDAAILEYDDIEMYEVNPDLFTNGNFETTTGWLNYTSGTAITLNSTYYISASNSGVSLGSQNGIKKTVSGLSVGKQYTFIAHTYNTATTTTYLYAGSSTYSLTPTANAWNALSLTFNATATSMVFRVRCSSDMYVDEAILYDADTTSKIYQLVTTTPGSDYKFSCYFNNGSISTLGQGVTITVRRGSNVNSVWSTQSYTVGSSYALATIIFTCPSDESSMYICFQRDSTATGSIYVDDFSAYIMSAQTTQYIEQTISGLTEGKRYRVSGYVLKPTTADAGEYLVGVYRTDTSALIGSVTGTATSSWVAFSNLTFDLPVGLTSVYLRLIRNSDSYGDLRFDTVTMYRMLYATTQSAYQDISTTSGYTYRVTVYVKNGSLTTHPYIVAAYNGSTELESDSGNTSSSWSQKTIYFDATGSTTRIKLTKNSETNGSIYFDTISVYRVMYYYEDQWIKVDQGSSIEEVDTLIIPSGHTLNGLYCQLQYSDNDSTWTDAVLDWTQSGSLIIVKSFTPSSHRYWRLYITGSINDLTLPSLSEFYLTNLYTLVSQPKYSSLSESYSSNLKQINSPSWKYDSIINSTYRRKLEYELPYCSVTEKQYLESVRDYCLGKKPFFINDHNGNQYFVEFTDDIVIEPVNSTHYNIKLKMMEVL